MHPLPQRLRLEDYDRYLISLRLPAGARQGCWAVQAFNLELAKIAPSVSEAMLGRIRLQWWREALDSIAAGKAPPAHDVAQALAEAVQRYNLPMALLEGMISARELDLASEPPAEIPALLSYLGDTAGALIALQGQCLKPLSEAERAACRVTGQRFGLIGILRAMPWHSQNGLCFIPALLLQEYGLTPDTLWDKRHADARAALVKAMLHHLPPPQPATRLARLYDVLTTHYQNLLAKHRYNVMVPALARPSVWAMVRLWGTR